MQEQNIFIGKASGQGCCVIKALSGVTLHGFFKKLIMWNRKRDIQSVIKTADEWKKSKDGRAYLMLLHSIVKGDPSTITISGDTHQITRAFLAAMDRDETLARAIFYAVARRIAGKNVFSEENQQQEEKAAYEIINDLRSKPEHRRKFALLVSLMSKGFKE